MKYSFLIILLSIHMISCLTSQGQNIVIMETDQQINDKSDISITADISISKDMNMSDMQKISDIHVIDRPEDMNMSDMQKISDIHVVDRPEDMLILDLNINDVSVLTDIYTQDLDGMMVDDRLEENDTAAQAALQAITRNTYASLVLLDDDWYMVNVCAGGTLDVRVDFIHANGDLDMKLYAEGDYNNPINSSISTSDSEQVSYTSQRGGNYFVQLYVFQDGHNNYDMVVNVLNCP